MQLKQRELISGCGEHRSLVVSKVHDRNLFRGRVFSCRNSWFKEPTLPDTNNLICSSCSSCASWLNQKHHLLVPISVNSWFFQNFFSQNEPNSNESDSTANPYGRGCYNGFFQKNKKETNPNEPNQSQFQKTNTRTKIGIPKQKLKK